MQEKFHHLQIVFHSRMSSNCPLPVKKKREADLNVFQIQGLSAFSIENIQNKKYLTEGGFGKISIVNYIDNTYVMKELSRGRSTIFEKKLFAKEAKLIQSLNHENIIRIYYFSTNSVAMLLEYVVFSFSKIGIASQDVNNLRDYLLSADEECDFVGFEHGQILITRQIVDGLDYLHNQCVAHRDLKPDNILVSNQHYDKCKASLLWNTNPVKVVITDFGESRSKIIQTQNTVHSCTRNFQRGTKLYASPESTCSTSVARMDDLKRMDIWSFGLVLYHLANPNIKYPYELEMDQGKYEDWDDCLKKSIKYELYPLTSPKYKERRENDWKTIDAASRACCAFNSVERPSLKRVKVILNGKQHSTVHESINPVIEITETPTEELNPLMKLPMPLMDIIIPPIDMPKSMYEISVKHASHPSKYI